MAPTGAHLVPGAVQLAVEHRQTVADFFMRKLPLKKECMHTWINSGWMRTNSFKFHLVIALCYHRLLGLDGPQDAPAARISRYLQKAKKFCIHTKNKLTYLLFEDGGNS